METSNAPAATAAPHHLHAAAADDLPPWLIEDGEPPARASSRWPRAQRGVANRVRRPALGVVPASILALTLVTALCVILGSQFGASSQPRELLPIMIAVAP